MLFRSNTLASQQLRYEVIGVGSKIVSQYPAAGTKLPLQSIVKIYVETESPELIMEVPNLLGLTIEEAKKAVNGFFTIEGSGSELITVQIPVAGTKIEKGNKIIVQTYE